MSYWVLPESGISVSVTTVQRLTNDERNADEMKGRMSSYDDRLKSVFEAQSADVTRGLADIEPSKIIDPEFFAEFMRVIDDANIQHVDDLNDIDVVSDQYIGMELALLRGEEGALVHATVRKRLYDEEGTPIGIANNNPLLDSRK